MADVQEQYRIGRVGATFCNFIPSLRPQSRQSRTDAGGRWLSIGFLLRSGGLAPYHVSVFGWTAFHPKWRAQSNGLATLHKDRGWGISGVSVVQQTRPAPLTPLREEAADGAADILIGILPLAALRLEATNDTFEEGSKGSTPGSEAGSHERRSTPTSTRCCSSRRTRTRHRSISASLPERFRPNSMRGFAPADEHPDDRRAMEIWHARNAGFLLGVELGRRLGGAR